MPRLAVCAIVLGLLSCTTPAPTGKAGECLPTIAKMRAPEEAVDFFAVGSSQREQAREYLITRANWYGNAAMWVILPEQGEIVDRLDEKIPPYRLKRGFVSYEARQLDGSGRVARTAVGPSGYGDIGFQAGGPAFPNTGCWEVTYLLNEKDPLRFVVRVR
jgi:hypothetical protein